VSGVSRGKANGHWLHCRYAPSKFRPFVQSDTGGAGVKPELGAPCFPEGLVREWKVSKTQVSMVRLVLSQSWVPGVFEPPATIKNWNELCLVHPSSH
jgi:hypothetical protein